MDKINYSTPEKQIKKLKSQKLIIKDEVTAKNYLQIYGYSNLIKSYREPYTINLENGKKEFRTGITFEQITSLFIMDKNLRNSVMAAMQDLEEHIKECAANVVAGSFGTDQNDYLKFNNYRDKRRKHARFSLIAILDTMKKTLNTDKDPINHYLKKHGVVPPWILFKSIYFSTIVNFISLFKPNEQNEMAKHLYDYNHLHITIDACRKLMMDTLFICVDYRNRSAHGGRIYNYKTDKILRTQEIFGKTFLTTGGFGQLLYILSLFKYQNPYIRLKRALDEEVNRHCSSFPQDRTYLEQVLNINIISHRMVYISKKSNKYHNNPHCSGILNSTPIIFEEAKEKGYIACKRCNIDDDNIGK